MTELTTNFDPSTAVFKSKPQAVSAFVDFGKKLGAPVRSSAATIDVPDRQVEVGQRGAKTLTGKISAHTSYEEKLFDSRVSLKVAVSQYAMHLSDAERHRIFDRLDSVINVDDWHEEDQLPRVDSFRDFLKWMIFSRYFDWSSIGVSNEGNVLVAWLKDDVTLTANFMGRNKVTWTATVESALDGPDHAVGTCSLQHFAKQALFYLGGGASDDSNEYRG